MYSWQIQSGPGMVAALLTVMVFSDINSAAQKRDMRQEVVTVAEDLADLLGVGIAKREKTETGILNGIAFSHFKWIGSTKDDGVVVFGVVYGAIDNANAIFIKAIAAGNDRKANFALLEAIVATFKKR